MCIIWSSSQKLQTLSQDEWKSSTSMCLFDVFFVQKWLEEITDFNINSHNMDMIIMQSTPDIASLIRVFLFYLSHYIKDMFDTYNVCGNKQSYIKSFGWSWEKTRENSERIQKIIWIVQYHQQNNSTSVGIHGHQRWGNKGCPCCKSS